MDENTIEWNRRSVTASVLTERINQDHQWGGYKHDQAHSPKDWNGFIYKQYVRAHEATHQGDDKGYRDSLIKMAALAMAALETMGLDHIDASLAPKSSRSAPANTSPVGDNKPLPEKHVMPDMVNHPPHYNSHPSGIEAIAVTEHFNFCVGNAIKYLWRSDHKGGIEDLKKARWYLDREIARLEKEVG